MTTPNRLRQFPLEVKREVQRRLLKGDYDSLCALSAELTARGYKIGKSALARHRQRILQGIEEIR